MDWWTGGPMDRWTGGPIGCDLSTICPPSFPLSLTYFTLILNKSGPMDRWTDCQLQKKILMDRWTGGPIGCDLSTICPPSFCVNSTYLTLNLGEVDRWTDGPIVSSKKLPSAILKMKF